MPTWNLDYPQIQRFYHTFPHVDLLFGVYPFVPQVSGFISGFTILFHVCMYIYIYEQVCMYIYSIYVYIYIQRIVYRHYNPMVPGPWILWSMPRNERVHESAARRHRPAWKIDREWGTNEIGNAWDVCLFFVEHKIAQICKSAILYIYIAFLLAVEVVYN